MDNADHETPKTLSEVLKDFKSQPPLQKGFQKLDLVQHWAVVVGPHVAQLTQRLSLSRGVLQVELKSTLLREELRYGEPQIIAQLNEQLGGEKIQKIRWY